MTAAQYSFPSWVGCSVISVSHSRSVASTVKVPLDQVLLSSLPGRAATVSAPVQALDTRLAHESRDPLVVDSQAPPQRQFGMNPGPTIRFSGVFVDLLDVFEQQRVRLFPGRGRPTEPVVVARSRHPQDSAGHRDINSGVSVAGKVTDQPIR
jgi:hypothetical protein